MDTNTTPLPHARSSALAVPAAGLATAFALVGPLTLALTALAVARVGVYLSPELYAPATLGMLLGGFAPHPASLVSVWTQDARAALAPHATFGSRSLGLVPSLLAHRETRGVTVAQLAGLVAGLLAVASLA